jgi:hypothetical protein
MEIENGAYQGIENNYCCKLYFSLLSVKKNLWAYEINI